MPVTKNTDSQILNTLDIAYKTGSRVRIVTGGVTRRTTSHAWIGREQTTIANRPISTIYVLLYTKKSKKGYAVLLKDIIFIQLLIERSDNSNKNTIHPIMSQEPTNDETN